jgi:hypothetical protein
VVWLMRLCCFDNARLQFSESMDVAERSSWLQCAHRTVLPRARSSFLTCMVPRSHQTLPHQKQAIIEH